MPIVYNTILCMSQFFKRVDLIVSVLTKPKPKRTKPKGHKETLGGTGSLYCLDCSDGITVVLHRSKLIKLYTLNMRGSL